MTQSPHRAMEKRSSQIDKIQESSHLRWSGLSRLLPSPAREVWELHRRASLCDRHLAEWPGRAYGRRVVHVHIGSESFTHALHQAINHCEVHPAVTAPLASKLADVLPERVLVLRFV